MNGSQASPVISVSRIAAWLGVNKQTVWANYFQAIGGSANKSFEELPDPLRARLEEEARRRGFRNASMMLASHPDGWQPRIPYEQCSKGDQERAQKIRAALSRVLEQRNNLLLTRSEWISMGLADYAREHGHSISRKRFMELVKRTLSRAGAGADFSRLDLYLDDRTSRNREPGPAPAFEFEPLAAALQRCGKPLTIDNIDSLWLQAVELFGELATEENRRALKRSLVDWLYKHVPAMGTSTAALRRNFERKLALASASDGAEANALADGRHKRLGVPLKEPIPETDIETIAARSAFQCGGRVAQGVREIKQDPDSGLTSGTLELVRRPSSSMSYVNKRVYRRAVLLANDLKPFILGKHAIDEATPAIERDYRNLKSMTVVTSDDFTLPVYAWIEDERGVHLTRGQCLLYIDVRSLSILGFSLQPERNYNSLIIRTLDNSVCQRWGIPRVKYYERGIWKTSRIVNNAAPMGWSDACDDDAFLFGWKQLGVRIVHAMRARSKPAELVGGKLQNFMERMLGYCGRAEPRDCPDITRRNKLAVERGESPEGKFLSFEQWFHELDRLVRRYNTTVQEGRILAGMSPDEAFEKFWPKDDPPTPYSGPHAHLYAHWVSRQTVRNDGVSFSIGKESYLFRGCGMPSGEQVLAWFDPGCPDTLGVTDLRQRNPIVLARERPIDFLAALDPESQEGQAFQKQTAAIAASVSVRRARFKVLQKKFDPAFRTVVVAPQIAEVGAALSEGRKRIEEKNRKQAAIDRQVRDLKRRAEATGLIDPILVENRARVELGQARQLVESLEEALRSEKEGSGE